CHLARTAIFGHYYSRLLLLSLVSVSFRNVVEGGSELWASIGAGLPIAGVETCLVRSRNQPLDINLNSDRIDYAGGKKGPSLDTCDFEEWKRFQNAQRAYEKAFLDRVLPHLSRVRVASLKIEEGSWISIQTMLDSAAPLLETLKIESAGLSPSGPPLNGVDLFSGQAPRLTALDIGKGFHFLVGSYRFSGLSSISVWSEKKLIVDEIIAMLRNSIHLSSLRIVEGPRAGGVDPSLGTKIPNETSQNQIDFPILLPKLRNLTLRLEGADRVLYLLEHIQSPSCHHLDLRHGSIAAPPHFVQRSLGRFLPVFERARGWTDISVYLAPISGFWCEGGPSVYIQTFSDTKDSPVGLTSLLDWIIEARGNQYSNFETRLFLREQGARVDCSRPELLTRLQRLGRVVCLTLDGSTSKQEWIRKLMEPNWTTPNENPRFFLPDLAWLYLSGFSSPGKDLTEVLQARYGKSPVPTDCQPPQLPPPLQLLKIGGPDLGSYTNSVNDIVGERNVNVSKYRFSRFDTMVGPLLIPSAINGPNVPHNFRLHNTDISI
ncbi:hypothetical protein FRC01_007103, partial [Tulasnella sp. 417]